MATLAAQTATEEIEKVTLENGTVETSSKTNNETLVALSSENVEASIAKFSSDDSGILCKNDSETSSSASVKSVELDADESQKSQDQKATQNKSSQESETSNCSLKSSQVSSKKGNDSSPKKLEDEDSRSSFNSTLKRSQSVNNDDENSCSSVRSTSTVKTSQRTTNKSDDESNDGSSSRYSSRKSSPQKNSQNTTSFKGSQKSARSNFTQDSNSRSSRRSNSRSRSRSTSRSSSRSRSTSRSRSRSRSTSKSRARSRSTSRSKSRSPTKTSQSASYRSDDDTSRSSFRSSKKSTPAKLSQKSAVSNLTEDNDSRSSVTSASSRSTIKNSQAKSDKNDDENSRSSFASSNKNTPQKSSDEKESKKKKHFNIIDSDSDSENENERTVIEKSLANSENSQSPKADSSSKSKSIRQLIDSDSDEEMISKNKSSKKDDNGSDSDSGKENSKVAKKPNKISNIIDSESESDREAGSGNDSGKENSKTVQKSHKLSLIVDSDSESDRDQRSDNERQDHSENEIEGSKSKKGKKKSEKKRTGSARASKDVAMQQIHSETQRLIRESHVSLPYHRPKQRTLEEFLNRKKTPSNLPKNYTNAERIQMFPEIISKVVKEKEKEAEDFYQSSDSEEDDKHDKTMEIDQIEDDNKIDNNVQDSENGDSMQIFCTQKMTQDDIQESHNKKDILLQRTVDFGATRKLFVDDALDLEESVNASEKHLTPGKSMESEPTKISKDADKESGIENKDSGNVESMDVDEDANNQDASMSEKKSEKEEEMSNKIADSSKKSNELESSIEEMLLNMSETEFEMSAGKKSDESNETNNEDTRTQKEESSVTSEVPSTSEKVTEKTNETSTANENHQNISTEDVENSKDPPSKVASDVEDDGEILDKNMLRDDYFQLPDRDEPVKEMRLSLKDKILSSASKLKPMIKSSPGAMIDLSNSGPIKNGASRLLDRFLSRHTPTHKSTVEKVTEVKIVRTEGVGDDVKIIEEVLPFQKAVEDDRREMKPGERFKLKKDLMHKIASARDEEWKHKEEDEMEDEEEESKCRGDDFYEGLPDEEELLEDDESAESEPEEDDMPIVEKPRRTCDFGDEEAEESEVDGEEGNEAEEEDENEGEEEEEEEEEEESEEEDDEESESEKEEAPQKPKKLRRIISAFNDDDDDSNQSESNSKNDANKKQTLERAKTDEDMFASQASNEGANPDGEAEIAYQPFIFRERCDSDSRSQACKTPLPKSSNILSMISPVAQLTALNTSLESAKKSASKTNNFDLGQISSQNTPTDHCDRIQSNCSMEKMVGLQKKLFEDQPDSVNDDELLAICSGRFTDTQSSGAPAMSLQNGVTDSQLMDICSGAFNTPSGEEKQTGVPATNARNGVTDSQLMDICSGAFNTQSGEEKQTGVPASNTQNGVTDSQLMDICSGTFGTQATEEKKTDDTLLLGDETSQDITLAIEDDEESKSSPTKRSASEKRSDESMFSSDSSKMSLAKSSSSDKEVFKNPMEAWLKKASAKKTQTQTQQKENEVTDSQLMGLCSGAFTTQPVDMKKLEENVESLNHDEVSQDFQLTLDDNSNGSVKDVTANTNDKQTVTLDNKTADEQPKTSRLGLRIASSSEDEDVEKKKKERPKKKVFRKKKVAKLQLSDDEDDEAKEFSDGESEIEEEEDEEKFVDYDSEENEVVVVPKKEIKKVAKKFLENEAELSESDWDSADEDEQGLDKLEFEEGDAEDIDEDQVKDELDRIHMKQVMDEDQRDVRMLQELLFDDGDLHSEGAGRERKFKWKNIDSMGTDELGPRTEDDPEVIEDEVDTAMELQMRKMRYEQLKFQEEKEQSQSGILDDDFGDSALSKTGLKIVSVRSNKKSLSEQTMNKAKSVDNPIKVVTKNNLNFTKKSITTSFSFSNMRGSFLARGDETLVRIAQHLPEKTSTSVSSIRNKKFVFAHLSPSVSNAQKDDSEQENDNTPAKDKKGNARKRKIFSSQTPRSTKKMKVDDRAAGKKLF